MSALRRIAVVTGTRADFGLLRPVMDAIRARDDLALLVYVTGAHLLPPARTIDEVRSAFTIDAVIEMQRPDRTGRIDDARAVARGIDGLADCLASDDPDVVLVLGDRIEAFAGAAAASIAGIRVAHLHGGDRAEGIADEALRHAITRLAHIHFPATSESARRIVAMGEAESRTHRVGSPAIDGIDVIDPLPESDFAALGRPDTLFCLHPIGLDIDREYQHARRLLESCRRAGKVLALHPNHDAGREGIMHAIEEAKELDHRAHLDRGSLIGLLRRVRLVVGNSSAGLIECAAIPVRCVNVGPRQNGREKPSHVIDCLTYEDASMNSAIDQALVDPVAPFDHPYGDGRCGSRTAEILATFDPDNHSIRKCNTF